MKKSFILLFSFWAFIGTNLLAQCNHPNPTDNPCTAPTFCNNAQLNAFCSTVSTPVIGRQYLKPAAFCGSLESPSWVKFIAGSPTHAFKFTANGGVGCNGNGVQAAIYAVTDCSDSATFVQKSNCINATGGRPIDTVTATGLTGAGFSASSPRSCCRCRCRSSWWPPSCRSPACGTITSSGCSSPGPTIIR